MTQQKKSFMLIVTFLRRLLIAADDIWHFLAAVVLMICAGLILGQTIPNLLQPGKAHPACLE